MSNLLLIFKSPVIAQLRNYVIADIYHLTDAGRRQIATCWNGFPTGFSDWRRLITIPTV
jgi:hypothetical protein